MAGFGTLMLLVSLLGLILARKKKQLLYKQRWMLWVLGLCTFAPFLANTAGWLVTELGRYPWTVYGLFTIKQSVSPNVSVASLLTSNIIYFLLFTGLAITMVSLIVREMRKGPDHDESLSEQEKRISRLILLIRGRLNNEYFASSMVCFNRSTFFRFFLSGRF